MEELRGLWAFVQVAEAGSFSAAARRLSLSVAALSKSIARLEAKLDAQLFVRTTRAQHGARLTTYVAFTAVGRERFLDYIDLLDAVVHDSKEALRGSKDPAYSASLQRS